MTARGAPVDKPLLGPSTRPHSYPTRRTTPSWDSLAVLDLPGTLAPPKRPYQPLSTILRFATTGTLRMPV